MRHHSPYTSQIGVLTAFVDLLRQHGFSDAEIAGIRDVFVARWSKRGDVSQAAEQLAGTLQEANFDGDPRVAALLELGTDPFDTPAGC